MLRLANFVIFVLFSAVLYGGINTFNLFKKLKEEITLRVFIKEDADVKSLLGTIRTEKPKDCVFISKENALREFKNKFPESAQYLQNLSQNPLPASFKVIPSNIKEIDLLATKWRMANGVQEVVYPEKDVSKVTIIERVFPYTASLGGIIFLLTIVLPYLFIREQGNKSEIKCLYNLGISWSSVAIKFIIRETVELVLLASLGIFIIFILHKYYLFPTSYFLLHTSYFLYFIAFIAIISVLFCYTTIKRRIYDQKIHI